MNPHKTTITIEASTPDQLTAADRRRIETFTRARRADFGDFLFREAARIRAERQKKQEAAK